MDFSPQAVNILLIDDDDIDVMTFRRTMRKLKIDNSLFVASDGLEALAMLRGNKQRVALSRPLLILLDLNMPRMSGIEFLQEIRQDQALKDLVVFAMTTSDDEQDRQAAYRYNVAAYLVKSRLGDSLQEALKLVDLYCHIVTLP